MTALTLPTKHRSLWHFVPGLALTAALTKRRPVGR